MSPPRYHRALVALHWLLAAMIVIALAIGMLVLSRIPNASPDKLLALRGHMIAGIVILVLMLVRFVVRLATDQPAPARTGNALLDRLAPAVHYSYVPCRRAAASRTLR